MKHFFLIVVIVGGRNFLESLYTNKQLTNILKAGTNTSML